MVGEDRHIALVLGSGGQAAGGGGGAHNPTTRGANANGGSGIVIVSEAEIQKAPGMWNLRTHYRQKRLGVWTS